MKKNLCLMTMVMAVVMLFLGCKKDQYTITVNVNDPEMGSVTGGGKYDVNTEISLVATPNSGYVFVQWNDGNTDNPRKVVVTQDATYTATFAEGGATISFQNNSWKAANIVCTNNPSSEFLQMDIFKTANDQNDIFLQGSLKKELGSRTYESSGGDFFFYRDPSQTYTDETGALGGNPGDTYYVWQVVETSFEENVLAIDLNAKTIDAKWSENLFNLYDFIEHNGIPTVFYPLTCNMQQATWSWGTVTKDTPVNVKTGLLTVK
jgi:hypothetical protein